jgi:hypothetical protein
MANRNTKNRQLGEKAKPQSLGEGKFLVSSNPKRNMAQVVYHNTDASGKKFSLTRHEPLDEKKAFNPHKASHRRKKFQVAGVTITTEN